jgi:hypothetical protein
VTPIGSLLTREHDQLKPFDSALILHKDSKFPSDSLSKILGVNTPLFLFDTQFYFPLSSLLLRKSHKCMYHYTVHDTSIGSTLACRAGDPSSIPSYLPSF